MEVDESFYDTTVSLPENQKFDVELLDVDLDECPDGLFASEKSQFVEVQTEIDHREPFTNGNLNEKDIAAISNIFQLFFRSCATWRRQRQIFRTGCT